MKKYLVLGLAILLFIGGIYIGYRLFRPDAGETKSAVVNSEVVLTALRNEGFLVTQTYVLDERVEIEKSTGGNFKDLFFGQKIEARANVKVGVGVDLSKVRADDVEVSRDFISIDLPAIEIRSTEILGDVSLDNKQGILKKLFDNDDGYNNAVDQLKGQARVTANSEELRVGARRRTEEEVRKLIQIVDKSRDVEIRVK